MMNMLFCVTPSRLPTNRMIFTKTVMNIMALFTTKLRNLQSPKIEDAVSCGVGLHISSTTDSRFMKLSMGVDFQK